VPPTRDFHLSPAHYHCRRVVSAPSLSLHLAPPYPCRPSSTSAAPGRRRPRRARWNAGPKGSRGLAHPAPQRPARPRLMPLAGVALAPLLVTHLAPSAPRSCAATAAGRRPSAIRRARCSATAASGEAGELSRATLLWRAAKLPIYSVALVPLTVSQLIYTTSACLATTVMLYRQSRTIGIQRLLWQPYHNLRVSPLFIIPNWMPAIQSR
jgi:hypothetical protein